jgi:O-antigen/teichoic acid export membrane protein
MLLIALARIIANVCQAFSLILLARGITPAEYGTASAFIGISAFVILALDLGASTVILRYGRGALRGAGAEVTYVRSAYLTTWLQCIAIVAVTAIVGAAAYRGALGAAFVALLAIWAGFERASETLIAGLIVQSQHLRVAVVTLAKRAVPLGLQVAFLSRGITGVNPYALSLASGAAAIAVCFGFYRVENSLSRARPFSFPIAESLSYWLAAISTQTRDLETPAIGALVGHAEAGFYSIGAKLQKPFALAAVSAAQTLLPRVAEERGRILRELRSVWIATAACLGIAACCLPLAGPLVVGLLGQQYAQSTPVVQAAILLGVPFAFCSPLGALIQAFGGGSTTAVIGLSTAALSLLALAAGAFLGGALMATVFVGAAYCGKYAWLCAVCVKLARAKTPAELSRV